MSQEVNNKCAEMFSLDDTEVLDAADKILFIFAVAERLSAFDKLLDLDGLRVLYSYLEKGYRLSHYQLARVHNSHLFVKKQEDAWNKCWKERNELAETLDKDVES